MAHPATKSRRIVAALLAVLAAGAPLAAESLAESREATPHASAGLAFPAAARVPAGAGSRVAVIVLENKGYSQLIGNPAAPYLNSLARRYALATRDYAVGHPSLPNYLALTAGSTFGVHRDCHACSFGGADLLTELGSAGISWKVYVSGVPSSCYRGLRAAGYVKPLDPFLYFDRIARSRRACSRVVPMSAISSDLRAGTLPRFSWLTPSLCQDTHFCSVRSGDRFLSKLVPPLLRGLGPEGTLFVLWDEGTSRRGCCGAPGGGHVPAIVAGPEVRRGYRIGAPMNQYTILRALESAFGVRPLRHARSVRAAPLQAAVADRLQVRGSGRAGLAASG